MSNIKLKIDIKNGTLDIESDQESFEAVSEQAQSLLAQFAKVEAPRERSGGESREASSPENISEPDVKSSKPKKRSKGTGKTANWTFVNDLLSREQGVELREFFKSKSPRNQNEQVAVLVVKLMRMLDRSGFDGNEVHTAFRAVDCKTPGNLTAVFGNMTGLGYGSQQDKKFLPNWKAEELVDHDLPAKEKSE